VDRFPGNLAFGNACGRHLLVQLYCLNNSRSTQNEF
jgi:hypothetical protein